MKKSFSVDPVARKVVITLCVLGLLAAVLTLPFFERNVAGDSLFFAKSHENGLPNYDIRTDKRAIDKLKTFRLIAGRSASTVAEIRETTARAVQTLKQRTPGIKIEYNDDIRIPEVIAPDILRAEKFLTRASSQKRPNILKHFLRDNAGLVGVRAAKIDELKVAADYTNPDGTLSFVELNQEINGVPVFRGEVKAGFTRSGEIIRVINNLARGIDDAAVSTDFGDPVAAVRSAALHINIAAQDLATEVGTSTALKVSFVSGDSATTAEKMYFPTEPGVVVPAWRVLIWQPVDAHYIIVDAGSGALLWRKNITEEQTQSATYNVYANPMAMVNVAQSPNPTWPGPISPDGSQGGALFRANITRVGNESPYNFNQLGWISDGATVTDGNAVQAGLDRDGVDGIDPGGEAVSASRNFSYSYMPLSPASGSGDAPVPVPQTYPGSGYQQGSVTQVFYVANRFHDETYLLGFTEAARNFQNVNFTGEGLGGDRLRAEGQDSLGTNSANFATPADGTRGRLQMYLWTGPEPDLDGNFDSSVVIHELTHGLSQRLHGNAMGLVNDMSRGLGEGWSDFFALAMLSQASDPPGGIYTIGAYNTYRQNGTYLDNSYYGIRRFPTVIRSSVGGPGNLPHNPLTFADIDATKINLSDGAFSFHVTSGNSDAVHNAGEIWASALWEIRARFIARLGWEAGNRRVLQFVTDGMKLSPLSPTFLHGRDAMIAAALASGTAEDVADMWAGFAIRGLGASASIQNVGGTSIGGTGTARVTEAFDLPNLTQTPAITITDALGQPYPDPGEMITLTIPLTNTTGQTATGTSLQIAGSGAASYGDLPSGTTTTRNVAYRVPFSATCGGLITLTINVNSSLGPVTFHRTFAVGNPNTTFTESFDAVTPPAIPAGWTVTSSYAPMTFMSTSTSPDTAPVSMFAADLPNCTSGCSPTDGGSTELTSPSIFITAGTTAATVSFRHKYVSELGWDGGVLEISIGNAPFEDIITAGGTFLLNGYDRQLGVSTPNPLGGRQGWSGDSGGYITTVARLPAAAAGNPVRLRWRFGTDSNNAPAGGGWNVDSIQVVGSYVCFITKPPTRVRADFDGDGRTDISVYRPSEGNWYIDRSTQGFVGVQFGIATDVPTPGDFDGDGKTDIAVWRPSTGTWYSISSNSGSASQFQFGLADDIPQPGDFDGDGSDDIAVWRPSNGTWYWRNSGNDQFSGAQFGQNGDLPVGGDWDGDGRDDIAVWRPSTGIWYRINSSNGQPFAATFGLNGDRPVNADYDGDGREDLALFRPSNGIWYWQDSGSGEYRGVQWGVTGDVPVPGDFDGDGRADHAVFRNGVWYILRSSGGFQGAEWGLSTDLPLPKMYIP